MTSEESFPPGALVRVLQDPLHGPGPWPAEPTGVVLDQFGEHYTVVQTTSGPERSYWVKFDEPQYDVDGDGPYGTSQVLSRYLQVLS